MTARAIMLQGTGSDVGKSLIAAGLARAFANRGLNIAPFKPQNMSNNAAVTGDGGEIGRAQALQARAARLTPTVHMNPVLLKPETTTGAQVIIQGRREATLTARQYMQTRTRYLPRVLDSFCTLAKSADLVIVEGAGSPAETNLRHGDIANMGFAHAANIPALLIGDIHRGGVIAAIAGTFQMISGDDRARLKGFIINNFHGDIHLFDEGRTTLERETATPCLGVVPYYDEARKLPAEDAVALETARATGTGSLHICVLRLSRIANFDDLDPLKLEPGVTLEIIQPGSAIPGTAGLVIIPGSKSTMADLAFIKTQGWDIDLAAHHRRGGHILGLCGGYQMLGRRIHDPQGIEGPDKSVIGLGLLNVETTLEPAKTLANVTGLHNATGEPLSGYEIHMGTTSGPDCARPFATINGQPEGATSPDGRITGTYLHGCLAANSFRARFIRHLGGKPAFIDFDATIEETLDGLAAHLEKHLDLEKILNLAGPVKC